MRGKGRFRASRVRSSGTAPERRVRAAVERLNVAYSANASELPGSPDIVFDDLRKVLFVHGCFWHVHPGCAWRDRPVPRKPYWQEKLARNVLRDERSARALEAMGWEVAVVWECETRDETALRARLWAFLKSRLQEARGVERGLFPDVKGRDEGLIDRPLGNQFVTGPCVRGDVGAGDTRVGPGAVAELVQARELGDVERLVREAYDDRA